MRLGVRFLVTGHLHDARPVPQVDEDQRAVIAAAVHPPGQRDRLTDVLGRRSPQLIDLQHGENSIGDCRDRQQIIPETGSGRNLVSGVRQGAESNDAVGRNLDTGYTVATTRFQGSSTMRCLVTGGAGFIGTALANRLVHEGHHVRVLDDLSAGDPGRLHPDVVFTRGDVRDRPKLWTLLQKVDCVFHLAARVSVPESVLYPREYNDVNVGGTVALTEAIRDAGVERIVFASSATVYGPQTQPARARVCLAPPTGALCRQQAGGRTLYLCIGRAVQHHHRRPAYLQRIRSRRSACRPSTRPSSRTSCATSSRARPSSSTATAARRATSSISTTWSTR